MTAFVFGEEKSAKLIPKRIKLAKMYFTVVPSLMNVRRIRPTTVTAMPVEATRPGSNWSESLPAKGDRVA